MTAKVPKQLSPGLQRGDMSTVLQGSRSDPGPTWILGDKDWAGERENRTGVRSHVIL